MALSLTCKRLLRLSIPSRHFLRPCSTACPEKKGLVLGVYSDEECEGLELTPAAEKYNQISQGKLVEQLKLAGNKVKPGHSFQFWGLDRDFHSVAVVGLGKKSKPRDELERICEDKEAVRIAAAAGCNVLQAAGVKDIRVESLGDAEAAAEGSKLSTWKFQEYRTKKEVLPGVDLYGSEEVAKWNRGVVKADAQNLTRRLADTPANLMTPTIFAETVSGLAQSLGITVQIRDKEWAEKEKMGGFLAVAQGSCQPPKFLEISYKKSDSDPFVLVGKGVTFDAGGICIKQSAGMDMMRCDMTGAACVVGTIYGIATLQVPVHVKALIPLVENLASGASMKPGDVITTRSGKTVCICDTDNEGRLILADAISYSSVFKPRWVLDIATLTLDVIYALGAVACGAYSNSDQLYKILEEAGSKTGDRVWRMPLWKYYTKQITEYSAYDINNVGKSKWAGSCTAAAFLREFVPENTDWVHIDMAGMMGLEDGAPHLGKGVLGRPTRTLIEFIEAQAKQ